MAAKKGVNPFAKKATKGVAKGKKCPECGMVKK